MALLSSSSSPSPPPLCLPHTAVHRIPIPRKLSSLSHNPSPREPWILPPSLKRRNKRAVPSASCLYEQESLTVDVNTLAVSESVLDEELLAAVRLRVRTFYEFNPSSVGVEDHKRCLTEREFEAFKDRIAGERIEFKRVSCINATVPLSPSIFPADDLCSSCKFSENGVDRVVVATLDLNQCLRLAGELTGKRPPDIGSDVKRAYLSNVCVAKELQRNGLGYALVTKSKIIARRWGITDLYVHVAVENKAAQKLYQKCGFVHESEESAWQARFLARPRRYLLWADLKQTCL